MIHSTDSTAGSAKTIVQIVGLYDGDCGICSAFAAVVVDRSAYPDAVTFIGSQSMDDAALASFGLTRSMCEGEFILLNMLRQEVMATGARAITEVLVLTRFPFARLAAFAIAIPTILALEDRVYRLVARNRVQISQRLGLRACGLPKPSRSDTVT